MRPRRGGSGASRPFLPVAAAASWPAARRHLGGRRRRGALVLRLGGASAERQLGRPACRGSAAGAPAGRRAAATCAGVSAGWRGLAAAAGRRGVGRGWPPVPRSFARLRARPRRWRRFFASAAARASSSARSGASSTRAGAPRLGEAALVLHRRAAGLPRRRTDHEAWRHAARAAAGLPAGAAPQHALARVASSPGSAADPQRARRLRDWPPPPGRRQRRRRRHRLHGRHRPGHCPGCGAGRAGGPA